MSAPAAMYSVSWLWLAMCWSPEVINIDVAVHVFARAIGKLDIGVSQTLATCLSLHSHALLAPTLAHKHMVYIQPS